MTDTFTFITDIIRLDIIIGFGLYSILFFIIKLFIEKKEFIIQFDENACKIAIYSGIIFAILWLIGMYSYYFSLTDELEKTSYVQRLTGKYWFGYWLQPLFWILLTQLLRIRLLRKNLIFRIIMSLLFVITFERFIIIVTSFHRDYLPSSWSMNLSITEIIGGLTSKILIFIVLVSIFHFGKQKVKTLYNTIYSK